MVNSDIYLPKSSILPAKYQVGVPIFGISCPKSVPFWPVSVPISTKRCPNMAISCPNNLVTSGNNIAFATLCGFAGTLLGHKTEMYVHFYRNIYNIHCIHVYNPCMVPFVHVYVFSIYFILFIFIYSVSIAITR